MKPERDGKPARNDARPRALVTTEWLAGELLQRTGKRSCMN